MLREMLLKIMAEYPKARTQEFSGHELAHYIRTVLPSTLKAQFHQFPNIEWAGSAGKGQWADAPWIAALDILVTDTPQEGYYPVLLFTRTLDAVYLSLNQGMTRLREEFGANQAKNIMSKRALILRTRLQQEYEARFSPEPIDLQHMGQSTRLAFYEPGHVFGARYSRSAMPNDVNLLADFEKMLTLYQMATARGGFEEFDVGHSVAEEQHSYNINASLEEKRRLRLHYSIERNTRLSELAKKYHGYKCQICGFDYQDKYGDLGHGYIEAHHLTPLSQLPPNQPTKLSPVNDFAVLCANCHRMIHRKGAPATFDEFKRLFG